MQRKTCEKALRLAVDRRRQAAAGAQRSGDLDLAGRMRRIAQQLELIANGIRRSCDRHAA